MEIKKLTERENVQTAEAARRQKLSAYQGQQEATNSQQSGEDQVTISPLSRQLNQVADIVAEDDAERQLRVANIKQQVQDGTYSVDRLAVARSVISFAADTEDLG